MDHALSIHGPQRDGEQGILLEGAGRDGGGVGAVAVVGEGAEGQVGGRRHRRHLTDDRVANAVGDGHGERLAGGAVGREVVLAELQVEVASRVGQRAPFGGGDRPAGVLAADHEQAAVGQERGGVPGPGVIQPE